MSTPTLSPRWEILALAALTAESKIGGKRKRASMRSWRRSGVVGAATGAPGERKEGEPSAEEEGGEEGVVEEEEEVVEEEEEEEAAALAATGRVLRGGVEGDGAAGVGVGGEARSLIANIGDDGARRFATSPLLVRRRAEPWRVPLRTTLPWADEVIITLALRVANGREEGARCERERGGGGTRLIRTRTEEEKRRGGRSRD